MHRELPVQFLRARLVLLLGITCTLCGCGIIQPVPAFERGVLASEEMAWNPDPAEATYRDHMHNSKEAAKGRPEAAGAGCGCY